MEKSILFVLMITCVVIGIAALRRATNGRTTKYQRATAHVIDFLRRAGTNVLKVHEVEFVLYFSTQQMAEAARTDIDAMGLTSKISKSAEGNQWLCLAMKEMLPIQSQIIDVSERLTAIALKYDGKFDGWGTAVVE